MLLKVFMAKAYSGSNNVAYTKKPLISLFARSHTQPCVRPLALSIILGRAERGISETAYARQLGTDWHDVSQKRRPSYVASICPSQSARRRVVLSTLQYGFLIHPVPTLCGRVRVCVGNWEPVRV